MLLVVQQNISSRDLQIWLGRLTANKQFFKVSLTQMMYIIKAMFFISLSCTYFFALSDVNIRCQIE